VLLASAADGSVNGLDARIGEIARRILGEPNRKESTRDQLRFGTHA
jgi:hypothetical protein